MVVKTQRWHLSACLGLSPTPGVPLRLHAQPRAAPLSLLSVVSLLWVQHGTRRCRLTCPTRRPLGPGLDPWVLESAAKPHRRDPSVANSIDAAPPSTQEL